MSSITSFILILRKKKCSSFWKNVLCILRNHEKNIGTHQQLSLEIAQPALVFPQALELSKSCIHCRQEGKCVLSNEEAPVSGIRKWTQGHKAYGCWTCTQLWVWLPGLSGTSQKGLCAIADPASRIVVVVTTFCVCREPKRAGISVHFPFKEPLEALWGRAGKGWSWASHPLILTLANRQLFSTSPAATLKMQPGYNERMQDCLGSHCLWRLLKPEHLAVLLLRQSFHLQQSLHAHDLFWMWQPITLWCVNNLLGARRLSACWYFGSLACLANYGGWQHCVLLSQLLLKLPAAGIICARPGQRGNRARAQLPTTTKEGFVGWASCAGRVRFPLSPLQSETGQPSGWILCPGSGLCMKMYVCRGGEGSEGSGRGRVRGKHQMFCRDWLSNNFQACAGGPDLKGQLNWVQEQEYGRCWERMCVQSPGSFIRGFGCPPVSSSLFSLA